MKLTADIITRLQLQNDMDFLRVREGDLTASQLDLVKRLRKVQHDERGLSDDQVKELAAIVKSLKKNQEVIIRKYY